MRIRHCWVLLASLAYSSYCYSDELVFGQTPNAAAFGYNWVMTNILPKQAGLEVNGMVYRYTVVKKPEDDMLVHISNLNAKGEGYIFRNTDNWSKLPGNTIQRSIPIANIPIDYWGDGSIEVEGEGDVEDPFIVYTYQFDPCFDPQSDPACPGYKIPVDFDVEVTEVIDPLDDQFVQKELERKARLEDEEEDERERRRSAGAAEQRQRARLEVALGAVNAAMMTAETEAKASEFFAIAEIPQTYVAATIPGGVYNETVRLLDSRLPDNPRGLRANWAQQLLHEKMMNLQYESLTPNEE